MERESLEYNIFEPMEDADYYEKHGLWTFSRGGRNSEAVIEKLKKATEAQLIRQRKQKELPLPFLASVDK